MVEQRHRARWVASRRSGSLRERTFQLSAIFPAIGLIVFMTAVRREASCSGFEREPDPRRTREQRLEWPLRMHLLSSVLFVFNQFGDLERCSLRPGNVHSADG